MPVSRNAKVSRVKQVPPGGSPIRDVPVALLTGILLSNLNAPVTRPPHCHRNSFMEMTIVRTIPATAGALYR